MRSLPQLVLSLMRHQYPLSYLHGPMGRWTDNLAPPKTCQRLGGADGLMADEFQAIGRVAEADGFSPPMGQWKIHGPCRRCRWIEILIE